MRARTSASGPTEFTAPAVQTREQSPDFSGTWSQTAFRELRHRPSSCTTRPLRPPRTGIRERHAGEMILSTEGRRIAAIAERAEQELSRIRPNTEDQRLNFGKVRIAVSEHMLAAFAPEISALIDTLPEVFLEFTTSDRFVDLVKYEADIVLRVGRTAPSAFHSINVGSVRFACFRPEQESGPLQKYWRGRAKRNSPNKYETRTLMRRSSRRSMASFR